MLVLNPKNYYLWSNWKRENISQSYIFISHYKAEIFLALISTETVTFLLLMVYLIHAVGNFASVSLTFTTEKCLSYFVKLYFIILKYFVKPYFISHYRAEIFLRLLSSVQKRLLFYYLWFTYSRQSEILHQYHWLSELKNGKKQTASGRITSTTQWYFTRFIKDLIYILQCLSI